MQISVWRPHGATMLRQLKFQAHNPTPDGGWRTREIARPASCEEWHSSWEVFAFAMEVLQAASRARLARNAGHIRKSADTYPEFWWIVATDDSRYRAGCLERVRRVSVVEHAARHLPHFEPARPGTSCSARLRKIMLSGRTTWTGHLVRDANRNCVKIDRRRLQTSHVGTRRRSRARRHQAA